MADASRKIWVFRGVILLLAVVLGATLYEVETYRSRLPPPPVLQPTGEVVLEHVFPKLRFSVPVYMTQPPGDPSRFYVVEVHGLIKSFANDPEVSEAKVELDLSDRVRSGGETGLLSMAFHPDFAANGAIFVNYTALDANGDLESRISRFARNSDGTFDRGAEEILLRVKQPYETHNGGLVAFGPDGYLYIGLGDGGLSGDPHDNAQDPKTLLGSILRVEAGPTGLLEPVEDNPFADGKDGDPRVFAYGFRNPWRFTFDAPTGDIWAGDVGQDAYEEIDLVEKGKNYGWPIFEGKGCYDPPLYFKVFGWGDCEGDNTEFVAPVHDYSHAAGDVSVTLGHVYRGPGLPSLQGHLVYGDFSSGKIWAWNPQAKVNRLLLEGQTFIPSFWQDHDGRVGILSFSEGTIHALAAPP